LWETNPAFPVFIGYFWCPSLPFHQYHPYCCYCNHHDNCMNSPLSCHSLVAGGQWVYGNIYAFVMYLAFVFTLLLKQTCIMLSLVGCCIVIVITLLYLCLPSGRWLKLMNDNCIVIILPIWWWFNSICKYWICIYYL